VEDALANRGFESRRPDQFSVNVLNVNRLYKRKCACLKTVLVTILLGRCVLFVGESC
jgi:hypothetical protein